MTAFPLGRSILAACAATAMTLTLAACGDSDDDANASGSSSEVVTVDHRFGSTDVEGVPERVVTIDVQWTDVMLSMGVEPVGYSADALMPESGVPWREDERSGEEFLLEDGIPLEEIAALDPDLIVGTFSIADKQTYDQLSNIAPTIAAKSKVAVEPWQDLVTTAGKILDEQSKAKDVIAGVEGEIESVATDLPKMQGKTFALAQYLVSDSSLVAVADENDGSSILFKELGMKMLPVLKKEGQEAEMPRVTVSPERSDLLEADFLAFLVNGGDESDLDDIPGFDQLPASKSGAVAVLDYATIVGINTPTPLSIPYALEQLRPYLEKVA